MALPEQEAAALEKPAVAWSGAALELFRLDRDTGVSAGAGSGKTTALVELCVRVLSGEALGVPCDPAEVVAITFTEKAAHELGERLREAVAERVRRAAAPDEARAWAERLAGLDRMPVGTIHAFAARLLREHALEAGVDPDYRQLEGDEAEALLEEAGRAAVVAAADEGRPVAMELAAASGAGRLASMVAALCRERSTLGQPGPLEPAPDRSDDARAARERALAAARALVDARGDASTPSGRSALAALAEGFAALSPGDLSGPLTLAGCERLEALYGFVSKWRTGKSDDHLRALKDELKEACAGLPPLAAEALAGPQKRELCRLVAEAEALYAAKKRAERALDFDDLLLRARGLLARDAPLREELRARTKAVLVDEYQDVNRVQEELFSLLCGPGGARFVAVGDLKQSIYRFRGADVSVFAGLLARFERGDGKVLRLSDNHRSTPAVLELVNETFARAMQPARLPPRPYELSFGEGDRLVPRRGEAMRPACELLVDEGEGNSADRRAREAAAIAARIRALVSGAAGVTVRERREGAELVRRPRFADVAILFRRLTRIAEYERALRTAGVPYRLARGGGFYQAPEVRDLGELVASLCEPGDAAAWAALLRSPFCGVSDGALFALSQLGFGKLVRGAEPPAALAPAERERLARFLSVWRELHALRDRLGVGELLERAAAALDVEPVLIASPDGERRAVNLRKALSLARRWDESGRPAAAWARHLRVMALRPPREPEAALEAGDAVAVLSIHQAKGLEWPVVFVPDLGARPRNDARRALLGGGVLCAKYFDRGADRFADTASVLEAREEASRAADAESRRLLYVALTRARDYLVLSGEGGAGGARLRPAAGEARKRGASESSWRGHVEAAVAAQPGLARTVPVGEAATFAAGPALPPPEPPPPAGALVTLAPPRLARPPVPQAVRLAVTDLAEYARCPRRHWLGRHLGLPERAAYAPGHALADPTPATAQGTLAHAMLAELDLAAPPLERRAQLAASASRRGYDARSPAVRRILSDLTGFLEAPGGARLVALARGEGRKKATIEREVPFLMRLDSASSPACYLVGAIDALVEEGGEEPGSTRRRAGRERAEHANDVLVVDFKYASARPGAADRYRIQLLAYALAARRARPGARVRASVQFLRGNFASADVTPSEDDLARFAADAPRLAWEAYQGLGDRTPEALGRTEERCRAEGCGYVPRCYRKPS